MVRPGQKFLGVSKMNNRDQYLAALLDSRDVDQQQIEEIKKILAEREGNGEQ